MRACCTDTLFSLLFSSEQSIVFQAGTTARLTDLSTLEEYQMSNLVMVNLERLHEGGTYGQNVWRAFQIFLAALFGAITTNKPSRSALEKERAKSICEIFALARKFDSTMPSQAAELRYLVSRDIADTGEGLR
jgi:hypothetical protein